MKLARRFRIPRRRIRLRILPLLVILALFTVLATTLFSLYDMPFDSDEAVHALDGLKISSDLYHTEGKALAEDFYFTHWYPPLLPTYLAPFLILLGPAFWSARYAVLLLSIIYAALMYSATAILTKRPAAGLLAMLLTATSPFMWVHSLLVMEEMLALIWVLLTTLAYDRVERGRLNPTWLGVLVAAALLTRLSVGIAVAAAVAIAILLGRAKSKIRLMYRVFAPFALICLIWWGHPQKIRDFFSYVQASPPAYKSIGWSEIIYYWKAIVTTYTVSPLVGIFVLVSIVQAPFHLSESRWRLPFAVVMATWFVLLVEKQLNTRFFAVAVSASFLLAGNSLAGYLNALASSTSRKRVFTTLSLVIIAVSTVYLLARIVTFPFLMEVAFETDKGATELYAWITDALADDSPVFLINGWDQLSGEAFSFYDATTRWPHWHTARAINVLLVDPQKNPQAADSFGNAITRLPKSYIVHLGNTPVPAAGAWWAYRAKLETCWNGNWERSRNFWIGIWDGGLETEITAHPFRYVRDEDRSAARENSLYPLSVEAKMATCYAATP